MVRMETTAWTMAERAKPRISAQRICQSMPKAMLSARPISPATEASGSMTAGSCTGRSLLLQVGLRVFLEVLLAAHGAEVVGDALVLVGRRGAVLLDAHAADRVDRRHRRSSQGAELMEMTYPVEALAQRLQVGEQIAPLLVRELPLRHRPLQVTACGVDARGDRPPDGHVGVGGAAGAVGHEHALRVGEVRVGDARARELLRRAPVTVRAVAARAAATHHAAAAHGMRDGLAVGIDPGLEDRLALSLIHISEPTRLG